MRRWTKLSRRSIILKIVFLMTLVVLLQALFSAGLIQRTKVSENLESNAYGLFAEKVQNRENYLFGEMTNRWSNISGYKSQLLSEYNIRIGREETLSEEGILSFFTASAPILIRMMENSMCTGGFLILDDGEEGGASYSSLYIQNANPQLASKVDGSSNLVLLRGPVAVSKSYQIPLANSWSYGFALGEEYQEILTQPMYAASLTVHDQYQGFWHVSPTLTNPNNRMLTYSLPLRDQNGQIFGVMGVEIGQEYLYKMLPFGDFAPQESYGYFLATMDADTGALIPLISQGTVQKSILTLDEPMELTLKNKTYHCFSTETFVGPMSVHYAEIEPYSPNTPFVENRWFLVGLTGESNITSFSEQLNHTLLVLTLLSVIVGALVSFLIGYHFARPIMRLAEAVRGSRFDGSVTLARTGVTEIDALASAIEQLSENIFDSTMKTDRIMEMANMDVGSFEYEEGAPFVMVSSALQRMLFLKPVEAGSFSVPADQFFDHLADIKSRPEAGVPETYLVSEHPKSWYKIREISGEKGLLGVVIDVTKEVLERHALNYERDYDTLTGIFNRLAFHRKAQKIFSEETLDVAAIAMFDLDNLKYVNDTHGHETGDLYIKTAARIMESTLEGNTVLGRMAGDEFYVFFYKFTTQDEILELLNQLYRKLDADPIVLPDGTSFKVRMSGGISWYDTDSRDYHELIRYADFAMYEGKHTVKGELREFKREVYLAESFMLSGKEELNRVLDNQFIDFAFQPIVRAATGELFAYEALMRPQSDLLNTPTKLIQIATAQSQLWKIEKITFFKALSQYMKYRDLFGEARLFINSVPNQVLKDAEYEEFETLYAEALPHLVVEVIENERLDTALFQVKLEKIGSWGAKIALDDYGSGYNSDLSLLSIHPHIVKLDRFLIANVEQDPAHQAIVSKIIAFCKESGILVLAEGVESFEQAAYLVRAGVDFLQGYYIGKPNPLPNYDSAPFKTRLATL